MNIRHKISAFSLYATINTFKRHIPTPTNIDMIEYGDYITDDTLTRFCPLKHLISDKFKNRIDFNVLSRRRDLDEKIIDKYKNSLLWFDISLNYKIDLKFVKKYIKYIDFDGLSHNRRLSYEIAVDSQIRKKLNFSKFDYITLDEKIAEMFIDKINVNRYIFMNKNVSIDFIKKYCTCM